MSIGKTSTEVKARWKAKAYKTYRVYLRNDIDADLINYLEAHKSDVGTTEIFRQALEKLVRDN